MRLHNHLMQEFQLPLQLDVKQINIEKSCREKLVDLLGQDLDFHGEDSGYGGHNFHSFPAKFPPQLPRKFINALTQPGEVVLDPMMGSGTTLLEAFLAGRRGIGCDIDPLALRITLVKGTALKTSLLQETGKMLIQQARKSIQECRGILPDELEKRFDSETRKFLNYWFAPETQLELFVLIREIEKITNPYVRAFFELAFSAIIITKTGGVSFAFDLAHTRPHRAKAIITNSHKLVLDENTANISPERLNLLTKTLRSPITEFEKRFEGNLKEVITAIPEAIRPLITFGNAQSLPWKDHTADLIVTSPPYASNAIDYMRAHKFSLVWMKRTIDELSEKRKEY
ncbi:hypothetical protein L0152_25470, partial [bacterium]|nr:hypothetical protein [bacterium]